MKKLNNKIGDNLVMGDKTFKTTGNIMLAVVSIAIFVVITFILFITITGCF